MADVSNGHANGNGKRLEAQAESVLLRVAARWSMVAVVPALLVVIGWFGLRYLDKLTSATEENTRATNDLRADFRTLVEGKIPGIVDGLKARIESETGAMKSRLDAHVQRLDDFNRRFSEQVDRDKGQDGRIEGLQLRLWSAPSAAQSQPAPRDPITVYPPR